MVTAIGSDINERKQAEIEIQKTNSILSSVSDSPDNLIMFALDLDYNYLSFNKAHIREMKSIYDADIEIGKHIFSYMPNDDVRRAEINYKLVLNGERFIEIQQYGMAENGLWYELIFNPIYDDSNTVKGLTVFVTNITERKLAVEELAKHLGNLEEIVKEQTKELEEKNKKLDESMKVFVGREMKILNLEKRIKEMGGKV